MQTLSNERDYNLYRSLVKTIFAVSIIFDVILLFLFLLSGRSLTFSWTIILYTNLAFVVLAILGFFFSIFIKTENGTYPEEQVTRHPYTRPTSPNYSSVDKAKIRFRSGDFAEKYIAMIEEWVRICCFQTARLNEKFCECGRSISSELTDFIHATHSS